MAVDETRFQALMQRIRLGDRAAEQEFISQFGPYLLRVVRKHLDRRLRSRFDSTDFVQSVWASFFADPPAGEEFEKPGAMVRFLARITHNKLVEAYRQKVGQAKAGPRREESLDASAVFDGARPFAPQSLPARQPTPSQDLMAQEQWTRLYAALPSRHRRILDLRREGKNRLEIAQELGLNEKTVRLVLGRLDPRGRGHELEAQ
jgi:RNA polymerase sigma factor (sigma-70 family)